MNDPERLDPALLTYKGLVIVDKQRAYMFVGGGNGNVLTTFEKFLDSVKLHAVQK
jgi:hypothetical protein